MRVRYFLLACFAVIAIGIVLVGLWGHPNPGVLRMRDGESIECADLHGYRVWTCTLPGGNVIDVPAGAIRVIEWR